MKFKRLIILLLVVSLLPLQACTNVKVSFTFTLSHDTKYNSAIINVEPTSFDDDGFSLGDSINIEFSNGKTLVDVPYYDGYYVKTGEPVLVAYPGNDSLLVTFNNEGIWDSIGLQEGDTATLTLNEKAKYSVIQETLKQVYSFKREDYTTDEEFCNFRLLQSDELKDNLLYRGASPVDNSKGRASYVDKLLEEYKINYIIDLADSDDNIATYKKENGFSSDYALSLFNNNKMILLNMSSSYGSDDYKEKVVSGLKEILTNDGPYYIHCMEGKDRTGFVCMLIEALVGSSYDEMANDYMTTYYNYYKISETKDPEKYYAILDLYFNSFLTYLHNNNLLHLLNSPTIFYLHDEEEINELKTYDYSIDARNYLLAGGMSEEEIDKLIEIIKK